MPENKDQTYRDEELVHVCMMTYNHEKFVGKAIQSVVDQVTNFKFKLIIGDDRSTDKTRTIIERYHADYPQIIDPTFNRGNIGPSYNFEKIFNKCTSPFIAMLEGDDYWDDRHKLQKQVDFLLGSPDYVMCYGNAFIVDAEGQMQTKSKLNDKLKRDFTAQELKEGKMVLPLTLCFRNLIDELPPEFHKVYNGDKFLTSLLGNHGKGKYLESLNPAGYRKHEKAIWSGLAGVRKKYYNAETRAWLSRYYQRMGDTPTSDHLRNKAAELFRKIFQDKTLTADELVDLRKKICSNFPDIFDNRKPVVLAGRSSTTAMGRDIHPNSEKDTENLTIIRAGREQLFASGGLKVNWVLTRKCNYKCSYCTVYDKNNSNFVPLEMFKIAVENLHDLKKPHYHVTLTGGEPTLQPGFTELLQFMNERLANRIHTTIITNLSRSTGFFEKLCQRLSAYKNTIDFLASFHFEFANPIDFIKKVDLIAKNKFKIRIKILAHPEHLETVKYLGENIRKISSDFLFYEIIPVRENFGAEFDKRYNRDDHTWLRESSCAQEKDKIVCVESRKQDGGIEKRFYSLPEMAAKDLNHFKGMLCNAGINMIAIDEVGYIHRAVCFRKTKQKKYNIFNSKENLPAYTEPVVCPFERCACLSDLEIPKYLPDKENIRADNRDISIESEQTLLMRLGKIGWENKFNFYGKEFLNGYSVINNKNVDISIIVISWRLHPDTEKNFKILSKQTRVRYELIFVNNGAGETEFDSLKPYIDKYIQLKSNTGAYFARNVGAVFADADIIFFLEDDGLPSSNLLEAHRQAHKRYDVISVRGVYKPKTQQHRINTIAKHYYMGEKPFPWFVNLEGNASYNAKVFFQVGGWKDEIRFGYGGLELSRRIHRYDPDFKKQIYYPEAVIYHDYARDETHLQNKIEKQENQLEKLKSADEGLETYLKEWQKYCYQTHLLKPEMELDSAADEKKNTAVSSDDTAPLVSIVIPTYNRSGFLAQAIDSALSQKSSLFELLVVDDGSTDNTRQIIKEISDDKIRYLYKNNSGAPDTRNYGIKHARGKYILWLDDDDLLSPDCIKSHLKIIERFPGVDVIYGALQEFDDGTGELIDVFDPNDWSDNEDMLLCNLMRGCIIPNPGTIVKKKIYEEIGGYDVNFKRAHDYEFWTRAAAKVSFKKNYSIVCRHRVHSTNLSSGGLIDRSYESLILRRMVSRYGIETLFPFLKYDNSKTADAVGRYLVAEKLMNFGDFHNASKFLESIPLERWDENIVSLRLRCSLFQENFSDYFRILEHLKSQSMIDAGKYKEFYEGEKKYVGLISMFKSTLQDGGTSLNSYLKEIADNQYFLSPSALKAMAFKTFENKNPQLAMQLCKHIAMSVPDNEILLKEISDEIQIADITHQLEQVRRRILKNDTPLISALSAPFSNRRPLPGHEKEAETSGNKHTATMDQTRRGENTMVPYSRMPSRFNHCITACSGSEFDDPEYFFIDWIMTRRCNYKCSYCRVHDNINGFFVPIEKLKHAISCIEKIPKSNICIMLAGGEPTIHPDYLQFLELLSENLKNCKKIVTQTNLGLPLSFFKNVVKKLSTNKQKIFFNASYHFDHAVLDEFAAKAAYLAENQFNVEIKLCVHPLYMQDAVDVCEKLKQIQNDFLKLDVVVVRENFGTKPDKRYSDEDLAWIESFSSKDQRKPICLEYQDNDRHFRTLTTPNELISLGINRFKGMLCAAGLKMLSINANGDLDPAVCFRKLKNEKPNIYTDRNAIQRLNRQVVCPFKACGVPADIFLPKRQINEKPLLNDKPVAYGQPDKNYRVDLPNFYERGGSKMPFPSQIHQIINQLDNGENPKVIAWFLDTLIEKFPDFAPAHHDRAWLAHQQGDSRGALEHFQQAALLAKDNAAYQKSCGDYLHVVLGDREAAVDLYKKAVALDATDKNTLLTLAHLLTALQRTDEAQQYYAKVLEHDPHDEQARQYMDKLKSARTPGPEQVDNVGQILETVAQKIQCNDKAAAIDGLQQALRLEPDSARLHNDLGVLLYETGQADQAQACYEKAAELAPEEVIYQKNLADFYFLESADVHMALKKYLQALTLNPRDIETLTATGRVCMSLGKSEDARAFFECILEIEPWNKDARQLIAQLDDQIPPVNTTEEADPYQRAQVLASKGDLHGAIDSLKTLIDRDADNALAYNDLGVLYYETGDKKAALGCYQQAVRLDPENVTFLKNLADVYYFEENKTEDALKIYVKLLESDPQDTDCLLAAGSICMGIGSQDDARVFFERVLEIDPYHQQAQNLLFSFTSIDARNGRAQVIDFTDSYSA